MAEVKQPEVWLRGALPGYPALVQPVAHALLQAKDEIHNKMDNFPDALLWEHPAGVASPGFHLKHMAGVLDRLFTYAAGQPLSPTQLDYLKAEEVHEEQDTVTYLLVKLDTQIAAALDALKAIDEATLTQFRGVGRQQLPSTVSGLLFHAAEHTMRHTGQLLVTAQILRNKLRAGL